MLRCYITDGQNLPPGALLASIERNLKDGVDWIQIREKHLSARDCLDLVQRAVRLGGRIIVNTRADIAITAGAAGVHLPSDSIAPRLLRDIAPPAFLIGVSCHHVEEVQRAEAEGADYVVFGPVFAPLSKSSDLAPRGLTELRRAAESVRIPVLALGGITLANAQSCVDAGAKGIAGISLFQNC